MRRALVATLLLAVTTSPARAAWTGEPGHGLAITTVTLARANDRFDADSHRQPATGSLKIEIAPWLEYGLAPGLLAVAQPTWTKIEAGRDDKGMNKLFLGLRQALVTEGEDVLSIQPGLTLPLSRGARATALGNDRLVGELRLMWGHGFQLPTPFTEEPLPGFLVVEAAPRVTEGGDDTEMEANATLGLTIPDGTMVLLQAINQWRVGEASPAYRKHQIQPSVVFPLWEGISFQAGVTWVFDGASMPAETGAIAAFWLRF